MLNAYVLMLSVKCLLCGGYVIPVRRSCGIRNPPQASLPPSGEGFIQARRRYPESRLRLLGFRRR